MIDQLAKTGEAAKAGPIGLVVILLLCIACYFLFKSMSKHLRKVREEFPSDDAQQPSDPAANPAASGSPAAQDDATSSTVAEPSSDTTATNGS